MDTDGLEGNYNMLTNTIARRCPRCGEMLEISGLKPPMKLECVCGQRFVVTRLTVAYQHLAVTLEKSRVEDYISILALCAMPRRRAISPPEGLAQ